MEGMEGLERAGGPEVLLDVGLVHRDDVYRQVLKHDGQMAVVELANHGRLVVFLVERLQRALDALGRFAGLAPDCGLCAQDLHDGGHELAVDRRQGHSGVVAVDEVELEKLEGVSQDNAPFARRAASRSVAMTDSSRTTLFRLVLMHW